MQTRRPKERPSSFPLVLESQGVQRSVLVPRDEYPAYLPVPVLRPPGCLTGVVEEDLISEVRFLHVAGPSFQAVAERHGADFVGARLSFAPAEFGRMLAKIAFSAAVYAMGLRPFRNSPIRRVILGEDKAVGHWVGSWTGDPINESRGLHAIKVLASGTDIHVVLRLFAQFDAPEYLVVLGSAEPEFVASAEWPWRSA